MHSKPMILENIVSIVFKFTTLYLRQLKDLNFKTLFIDNSKKNIA